MSAEMGGTNPSQQKELTAEDFDLSPEKATAVISAAQKFVIPVPNFGDQGEALVHPDTGEEIKDYKGRPIGSSGIVFYNGVDRTPQAAPGDGSAVVIINEVSDVEAQALHDKIKELAANPNDLTLSQLKEVLDFARDRLKLTDMYNSTHSFIGEKMSPVVAPTRDAEGNTIQSFGLMKRDDRDICHAVFHRGAFSLRTGSETERVHQFDNGGVILKQGNDIRGIQPDIFARTYKLADGSPVGDPVRDLKWA